MVKLHSYRIGARLLGLGCPSDTFQPFRKSYLTSIKQTKSCFSRHYGTFDLGGNGSSLEKPNHPPEGGLDGNSDFFRLIIFDDAFRLTAFC